MLKESDLFGFTGTEHLYMHFTRLLHYTDGIKFMAEEAGAYWLIDAIASYQPQFKTNEGLQEFQLWNLDVAEKTAVLTMREDSGEKPKVSQRISFTDFPFSIKLYVENGVLLLPSEH